MRSHGEQAVHAPDEIYLHGVRTAQLTAIASTALRNSAKEDRADGHLGRHPPRLTKTLSGRSKGDDKSQLSYCPRATVMRIIGEHMSAGTADEMPREEMGIKLIGI